MIFNSEIKNTDTYKCTQIVPIHSFTVYRNNNYTTTIVTISSPKRLIVCFAVSEETISILRVIWNRGFIFINHMTLTTSDDLLRAFSTKNSNVFFINKR